MSEMTSEDKIVTLPVRRSSDKILLNFFFQRLNVQSVEQSEKTQCAFLKFNKLYSGCLHSPRINNQPGRNCQKHRRVIASLRGTVSTTWYSIQLKIFTEKLLFSLVSPYFFLKNIIVYLCGIFSFIDAKIFIVI